MGYKGIDTFFVECDQWKETDQHTCFACSTPLQVERKKEGHSSWTAAMSNRKSVFDYWYCPHSDKKWHGLLIKLYRELEATASPSLKKIIRNDMNEIIKENVG